jgi:hypothetical protein
MTSYDRKIMKKTILLAMKELTVTKCSYLSDVFVTFSQKYTILTVIIIELQNINHVNIKRLKNLADMNRYFPEN